MAQRELILCTRNRGKQQELEMLLGGAWRLWSLDDVGVLDELPETGRTLEQNALQKAKYVAAITSKPCMADDSGLEVIALDGAPGVDSAHFGGPSRDAGANMRKLLDAMADRIDRRARFRTVLAYVDGEQELLFQGVVNGHLNAQPRGKGGFGYDPLFIPDGSVRTFAEMDLREKAAISHRTAAINAFMTWVAMHPEKAGIGRTS